MEKPASLVHNRRPIPEFVPETPFSQRKRTPFRAPRPPKAPSKTCPPVSRIFLTPKSSVGPRLVSFKTEGNHNGLNSPHYNTQSNKSYFEQCFRVCEKLGEGSFGEVYRVCSRDDGKMYAVKKSRQPFRGAWDRTQKLAEVDKHEQLAHHHNCVRFYKAWEEKQILYIQTELCQMSLSEYADLYGKVSERRIWHMLVDLVKGLKHLHDNGLCHLDIKPANIFLADDSFTCKVGDFGLCSSVEQGFHDAMEGDAKYLAPELMGGQFGKPADIFSLGISLLELACDVDLPSGGDSWHLLRKGHIPNHLIEDLSPGLVDVLSRMMHHDPKLRPTVDELLADPCVVLAGYQHCCYKAYTWTFSTCKHLLGRVLGFFVLLLSIIPVRRKYIGSAVVEDKGGGSDVHNDSFSDEDELLLHGSALHLTDDVSDPNAKFNRSWIRNSPVKYPTPSYAGPPIPIDFGDSSFECDSSPEKMSSSVSSCDAIPIDRLLTVQPKKLMEAFCD